jgi:hypothetical protein
MTSGSVRDDADEDPDDETPPYRPHAYTVEGYLLGMDDFSTGAMHATGWRRTAAVVTAWAVLIPLGLSVVVGVGRVLELLVWH